MYESEEEILKAGRQTKRLLHGLAISSFSLRVDATENSKGDKYDQEGEKTIL